MLYLVLYLIASAYAAVYVGFPFSEQLPNVARIDEPYSFTLANISYRSTSDAAIVYSASNLPTWLSFDGGSRTFMGVPSTSDLGEFEITLLGEDPGDGSKASINYKMIVSNSSGLHLTSPDAMFAQIAQYGRTNGNSGLVVKQGDQFDIKLDSSIFESYDNASRPIIAYYGRSQDRSSLPNWIKFNSDNLSFSGTVPYVTSSIAPSFEYGFSFIASDYYGFAGAEAIFKLIVGAHELSTSQNRTIHVNGTLKSEIDEIIPIFSQVYLDGTLIDRSNISRVYSDDLPKYVLLNTDNYTLTGTFPDSNTFDNFSIYVQDVFQNTVVLPYAVSALGSVFTVNSLPPVNATRGEYFEYQLLDSLFTDANDTTVDVSYSADWLSFNKNNKTLSGTTPKNFDSLDVLVSAKSSFDEESKSFSIKGVEGLENPTSSSSIATSSATASSSASSSASASATASATAVPTSKSNLNKKSLAIGLGVGVPAFILLIAAIFLLCCCAKRRRRRNEEAAAMDNEKGAVDPTSPELNGPGFGQTFDKDDHDENAKQLAALNVLKLDKKGNALDNYDARSTSSSITHVDYNSDNSDYYDASEKPVKSWRANDKSDMANAAANNSKGTKNFRESEISLSTVNTEQLFSVRLVDDQPYRNSNQSSSFNSRQFLSNGSLNALLRSSSSGNIQRLDSEGNIVETLPSNFNNTPGISRPPSTNLNVLTEENARDISTVKEDNSITYHSPHYPGDETDASSFNLLAKFDNSRNPSQSNLERDLSNYQLHDDNFPDEFKATQVSNGEFKWLENNSKPNITTSTSIDHNSNNPFISYNKDLVSPSSDYFLHRGPGEEQSPATLQNTPMKNSNVSALSIGSNNSENLLLTNKSIDNVNHANTARTVAKLVDFTRKGSLRESAYKPDYSYHDGETAQIHDDNDSD